MKNTIILCLCALLISGAGWGIRYVLDDENEIHVYDGEDISEVASSASAGDVIKIHTGTYTEYGATFSTRIKFEGMGNVKWTADSNLWTLGCDSIEFENIYFEATRDGQLGTVSTYDWFATNCTFDCSTFTPASDAGNFVTWYNVQVLCRKSGGFEISDGDIYTDGDFSIGVPAGVAGTYYGMLISGSGNLHCADKVNFYATDSVRAALEMTSGTAALQEGGIIGNKLAVSDSGIAIRLLGDATLSINGGDIQANTADSAVIVVRTTAKINLDRTKIANKDASGTAAYLSTSSTASTIWGCVFDSDATITLGASDIISNNTPIMVNLLPDADKGADIGTEGKSIDSIFVDDLVVESTVALPNNSVSDEELDESAAFDWTGAHTHAVDMKIGEASPSLTIYDSDNETGADIDTSGILFEADGEPSIEFFASDGDAVKITVTPSDQLVFLNATGGVASNDNFTVNGWINYGADAQEDDDYEVAISGITALVAGLTVTFKANTANTGAATLEITSVGDLDVIAKMNDQVLATGDIGAGQIVVVVFDGGKWQMTSQLAQ